MKTTTKQKIAFSILFLCTIMVVLPVLFVLGIIIKNGWHGINWQFLTTMPKDGMRGGGIYPAIVGTLYLVSLSIVFSLPIGLLAAIYLNEYAKDNLLTRLIRLAIVNLSGVSSVVYGLFGLALFVTFMKFGVSILSGALTLAIMNLPIVITASREALASVPYSFREVSYSLGLSRWQTIRHSVLPFAIPGILTGAILSLARAAGETAPILFTVAAFYLPKLPDSIFDQAMALPYHLYIISTQIPNISTETRYATALVLVGIVFSMNIIAVVIRARLRKRKKW
ncbi:MAG: phosphate ABC transporter, permease protein PstA [Omnitrophica WOR_2 bacterium GWF2_43_52]|nr:MAG: phosphate ABC transporter, permease protein PstA [Omnitrophica WOR_2 bacterium GWC2_44_8]OGX20736.1 MAG: phosphate ABC transporter, permease protein PstA [Omnitrophica WOR_2 bacterium GWF2_43_52]OGX55279.1 MAG: phosphate ABC transporter, permease protein PstA [Omnitrophica WOR_2 bacterium RIFOXYC2_FULL_43_9]HAH19757.1 phosphate ABC transporter permease PtsA [Candidatus Omnitrophota bacterium]HBG63382.1 phosphate ABC transporter permease PtsA [Candidatus Omnitrophota bacterium]